MIPTVQFTVRYAAAHFQNYASTNMGRGRGSRWGSWDGERVDISFALYNYFQGGNLVIEYETTQSLGLNLGTTPVPNGVSAYYPNVTASFTGLAENTVYYWRPKFVTSNGTFFGQMQTFRTNAYLLQPFPSCPRYPCAI